MFQTRIKNVQKELIKQNLDALLITSVPNIAYLTGVTHFSKEERDAYILITRNRATIITSRLYADSLRDLNHLAVEEISYQFSFSDQILKILKSEKAKKIGFESEYVSFSEFTMLKDKISKRAELIPTNGVVEQLRLVKDDQEIENLRKACELTDRAFEHILKRIKQGVTEHEISAEIKYFIEKNGGGIAFEPIVAFGVNSAIPHHHSGDRKLASNSIILFDFGASWSGYCADMSRTIFFGKAPEAVKKMYEAVKIAQEKAIDYLSEVRPRRRSDLYAFQVDHIARDYIQSQGFPSIPHSVGHGIGLQVHELPHISPKSKTKLKPGMIITVEPGIYDTKVGGVRIEDDILIKENEIELLTKSSRELIEL